MTEPVRVGIAVACTVCGQRKAPTRTVGPTRHVSVRSRLSRVSTGPLSAGSLWPGETSDEFGYPVGPDGTVERARAAMSEDEG